MKKLLIASVIILAACSLPSASAQEKAPPQAGQASTGDTFTGTIITGHMKGGMANPRLFAEVSGADGQKVSFVLTKATVVTDVDGKTLNYQKDFRKGKKVEINYAVKNGQNEALSMRYLD